MKKLILCFLLMVVGMEGYYLKEIQKIYTYKNIYGCNDKFFQSTLITAAWAAKSMAYNFECFHEDDKAIFVAYSHDCIFFLRFNSKTQECEIEFNAEDDSFDYVSFKRVMDFYFLYN